MRVIQIMPCVLKLEYDMSKVNESMDKVSNKFENQRFILDQYTKSKKKKDEVNEAITRGQSFKNKE